MGKIAVQVPASRIARLLAPRPALPALASPRPDLFRSLVLCLTLQVALPNGELVSLECGEHVDVGDLKVLILPSACTSS